MDVLDIDKRRMAVDHRYAEVVVKSQFQRTGLEFAVPVRLALPEAEVPFSDAGRGIARILHESSDRLLLRIDHQPGLQEDRHIEILPDRIFAGDQGISRRRAHR